MVEKYQGIVKSIRKDKTAVCITIDGYGEDTWFDFASNVKPEFAIIGSHCEISVGEVNEATGNSILTFIKCERPAFKPGFKKPFQSNPSPEVPKGFGIAKPDAQNEMITRMSALKASSRIFEGTGKEIEFKRLTEEIVSYIEKGIWVETKKV
jgi:hypothetical protein